ncbi:MAG: FAD-dependent thymidylate synthase [bacterium]
MKLELLAWTPQPERTCAVAARLCTSRGSLQSIGQGLSEERVKSLINRVLRNGHLSILEHASFTFVASGLSRVCSHQLVRHRLASFAQQSQRYLPIQDGKPMIPPSVRRHDQARRLFEEACASAQDRYDQLLRLGIPPEDARYALPQASSTQIFFTMNARELHHFLGMRCCQKAQWEIRGLAWLVRKHLLGVAPGLFGESGPACFAGDCPEQDYACWREKSAFFQSSYHSFRELAEGFGLTLEEQRLPAAGLYPSATAKMLGCQEEALLRPLLIEDRDRWALLLSAKPEEAVTKINARAHEVWRPASGTRYRKLGISFLACPWLFTKGEEGATAFWDSRLDCQDRLAFSMASPWRFATLPPRCVQETMIRGGYLIEKV